MEGDERLLKWAEKWYEREKKILIINISKYIHGNNFLKKLLTRYISIKYLNLINNVVFSN